MPELLGEEQLEKHPVDLKKQEGSKLKAECHQDPSTVILHLVKLSSNKRWSDVQIGWHGSIEDKQGIAGGAHADPCLCSAHAAAWWLNSHSSMSCIAAFASAQPSMELKANRWIVE